MFGGKDTEGSYESKVVWEPTALSMLDYAAHNYKQGLLEMAQMYAVRRGDTRIHTGDVTRAIQTIHAEPA